MAHLKYRKLIGTVSMLGMLLAMLAGCQVSVEDGGYQPKIVDTIEETTGETTAPSEEQVLVPTDGAIGRIINGTADVYDEPDGTVISTLEEGTKVITIERTVDWFHIQEGWVKAECITLEPELEEDEEGTAGFVNADQVNVRSGPGTANGKVATVTRNTLVVITELEEDENKLKWGKFSQGWICMDYVTLDLFGVDVLVLEDKTQEMGMAGDGGVITEHNYGDWLTVRATEVVDGVAWGKVGDGWIDLTKTALSTYDAKALVGQWRSYESYNSWTFDTDGGFVHSTEDYELVGDKLTMKGNASTKEGAYIYDGAELTLYFKTVDGKKTATSVYSDTVNIYFSGKDLIWDGDSANPLIKDLTPQDIYDEKYKPKSDPDAVAWVSGSWLYFSSYTTAEDGSRTALGNVVTFSTDGSFVITAYKFTATADENGVLTWTAEKTGGSASGTYIYDGTEMHMTGTSETRTVTIPQGGETVSASGLDKIMSSAPDGTMNQTMYKLAGTDDGSLLAKLTEIFG